jgi:putative transposase
VTETGQISLHGNRYEVDPALVGRRIQLVFDPFDLTQLQVRHDDRDFGTAIPHELTVHVHPKATAEDPGVLDGMATTSPSSSTSTSRPPAAPSTSPT